MKAIQVKYIAPTNTLGSRYKASAYGVKSLTVPYQYNDTDGGAKYAAIMLCEKYGWNWEGQLVDGCLPNGDQVFCFNNGASL
jgi:hypothetical protein